MMKKIGVILVLGVLFFTSVLGFTDGYKTEAASLNNNFNVSITKPYGYIYFLDIQIAPLPPMMPFRAIVIGWVTVEVEAQNGAAEKVEFYVDNSLKATVTETPYEWIWKESMVVPPFHVLKAVGYAGGETASDEIRVLYLNPFG